MTPVARVDVPVVELASKILGVSGKDPARVSGILARGSLVSGDARYRWSSIQASTDELAALLECFPDHDPNRVLDPSRCVLMVFRGVRGAVQITAEVGRQRRLFRRRSFWDEALALLVQLAPTCERYSYPDGADVFAAQLTPDARDRLRQLGSLLRFTSLETHLQSLRGDQVELYAVRSTDNDT